MEYTRADIIACRNNSTDDKTFIHELNCLIESHGDCVSASIFKTLANLDLPRATAQQYWLKVLEHRRQLRKQLDRAPDLITVMSDFLQTSTPHLSRSLLIETSTFERVVHETIHDNLTGLFNRPYFDETYEQQVSLAKRYNTDLSILFLDIDDFKDVNDTYGHLAGDHALRKIADIIKREKRDSDIAARYGGEEFVLLMPHTENVNAFILGERIRKEIEWTPIKYHDQNFYLTISGGLSSYPLNAKDPTDLLSMADNAVYLAKGAGKNTISLYKKEKRRYLRIKLSQPVLVKELGFTSSRVYTGVSKDICIGGLLFENKEPLPIDSLIKASVPIGNDTPLLLIGTVVRVEKFGPEKYDIGITTSFKDMEKQANNEIAAFLKEA